MNEHIDTTVPTLDNDQIDALMAKLHENPDYTSDLGDSDGEAAHEEATFISEDETSRQLN